MQLAADDVIRAAHRRTTARRARGAAVSTLTVAALALGGTYLAGLDHTPDDTPAVAGDVRVVTVAEGVTAAPDLSVFYRVPAADDRLEGLAERLRALPQVDAAYVKPGAEPATLTLDPRSVRPSRPT